MHRTLSKSPRQNQRLPSAFLPSWECQPRFGDALDQQASPKKCHCTIYKLKHFQMIISEGPSEQLKRTAAMQAGWHSSAWLCWPHPSPICIILIILCLSIPAWSIPCQFTGQVLWRWVLCGFPLCSDAWATRAQLMFSQAWTPWQPRGAICAKLQRQPGIRTPSLKKLWLIAAERKSAKSMHKKNRNSRSLVQTYTSFVRVPLISKWPLVSTMGFHEIQQNSHQEEKTKPYFLALPQELICQQICCFPGAAQEDLLYSFCGSLITQSQQSGGISILTGAPGPEFPRAPQILSQLPSGEKRPH